MSLARAGLRGALALVVLGVGIAVPPAHVASAHVAAPVTLASPNGEVTTEPNAAMSSLSTPVTSATSCGPETAEGIPCTTVTVEPLTEAAPRAAGSADESAAAASSVSYPLWCTGTLMGTRTGACVVTLVTLTTRVIESNGAIRVTGELFMNRFDYTYASTTIETFAHQSGVASYNGWGDALGASVSGTASRSGSCTTPDASFPPQQVLPHHNIRDGEAFYGTTATAIGAVGFCTTTWSLVFTVPGYSASNPASMSMDDIRCDNAVGAQGFRPRRVGCVVYWYASAATYSQSSYPTLTRHVSQAQQSGLPGATFSAPLVRTTNQATIDLNRQRACGDAPSLPGLSCDEYPLASSTQGLAAGGTRRSFPGCLILAPSGTGPSGASACMIEASENNAQGGIMAAFYYDWRVLDGDPYRVIVVS
jgi:hypothetical protein